MTGYIYCHTSPSGKKYIGQTTTSLEHRFNNGNNYTSSTVFWTAIQKYGWENFKHEILHTVEANSKEELIMQLNILEREEICNNNSLVPNGYNIELGGGQGRVTAEKRQRISRTALNGKAPLKEDLINLYVKQNLTMTDVSKRLGINIDSVSKWLKWYNIPVNFKHRDSKELDIDLIKKLYLEEDKTQYQISKELDVPLSAITTFIKKHNLYKRKGRELSYEQLKEYYINQNFTAKKCAELMNTTYNKVRRYIIKYNLQKGGRGND